MSGSVSHLPGPRAQARNASIVPWVAFFSVILALVSAVGLLADPITGWASLLVAAIFGIQIAMGAALFAAIHGVSGARWWNPLRRIVRALAGTLAAPTLALLLVLLLGTTTLYPWADPHHSNTLIDSKRAWLNVPLFLARAGGILLIWFVLIQTMGRRLGVLSAQPTKENSRRFARVSALFLVVFGLTISVAFWDWTMSLEVEWFSTMYGVYGFAGSFLGGIAAIIVAAAVVERLGLAHFDFTPDLMHDLGKLMFGFSMFWAYIWFCQFMLIWYANMPEETVYFATRTTGGWSMIFWTNPIVSFVVPFVVLLPESMKRNKVVLVQVAVVVLIGRWIDVHLMITPAIADAPAFPGFAIAATLLVVIGMGALFLRAHAKIEE